MIWLPFTIRIFFLESGAGSDFVSRSSTQGPAAFTRARALCWALVPLLDLVSMVQRPPLRVAEVTSYPINSVAPCSAASVATVHTRRESSTKQSEYSKPLRKVSFKGVPVACERKLRVMVAGSSSLPPMWSYKNNPSRRMKAGRRALWCGSINRIGEIRCGAAFHMSPAL